MASSRDQQNHQLLLEKDVPKQSQEVVKSTNAIFDVATIRLEDAVSDPVHYWLGMWGKLVILGAIKQQSSKQGVDHDNNIHELNWDAIFREVLCRTPRHVKHLVSASSCSRWYENRVRIFKAKSLACSEPVFDQLFRHYCIQLRNLIESQSGVSGMNSKRFYWENVHQIPGPGINDDNHLSYKSSNNNEYLIGGKRSTNHIPTFLSSTFCSFVPVTEDSPASKQKKSRIQSRETSQSPKTQKNSNVNQNLVVITKITSKGKCVTQTNVDKVLLAPGHIQAAVIEHNAPMPEMDSLFKSPSRKRFNDELDAELAPTKLQKRQEPESLKFNLIGVMYKLRNKHSLLHEMSQIISKKTAIFSDIPCEHTLGRIEEKIETGEITNVETLFYAFRSLVSFYLHYLQYRSIPKNVYEVLEALRNPSEESKL